MLHQGHFLHFLPPIFFADFVLIFLIGSEISVSKSSVVDLIIERENDIDIVDYKFSNLKIDVLKDKYAEQLALYKKAVESAFNKPVKNTYIYSINTGELK